MSTPSVTRGFIMPIRRQQEGQRRLCRRRRPVYLRRQPLSRRPLSGHRLRRTALYCQRSIQKLQKIRYAKQRMSAPLFIGHTLFFTS
jgi:hypothetical protein